MKLHRAAARPPRWALPACRMAYRRVARSLLGGCARRAARHSASGLLTLRRPRSASRLQSMLKDGHKHLSGLDEAVIKNIDACKQLSKITRTSLGPNGAPAYGLPECTCFRQARGATVSAATRAAPGRGLPVPRPAAASVRSSTLGCAARSPASGGDAPSSATRAPVTVPPCLAAALR